MVLKSEKNIIQIQTINQKKQREKDSLRIVSELDRFMSIATRKYMVDATWNHNHSCKTYPYPNL